MLKWITNFVDAVMWVFYASKDKSLEKCSDVAQEDVKQGKDKEGRSMSFIPVVGVSYDCFDDGKITESRRYSVVVSEVVAFDKIDAETKQQWLDEVKQCYWLYSPSTDFFIRARILDTDEEDCLFVRTKDWGWFSLGWGGRLFEKSFWEQHSKEDI